MHLFLTVTLIVAGYVYAGNTPRRPGPDVALSLVTRGFAVGNVNLVVTRGYSAAAFVASITVTLTDVNNAVIPNLTGLKWAWWDSPTVSSQVTPTATGTGATTNGSGLFSIGTLTGTALTSGQTGWIEITNSDGTVSQSPVGKVAAGPVTVN